jgi:hypothetical protein
LKQLKRHIFQRVVSTCKCEIFYLTTAQEGATSTTLPVNYNISHHIAKS